MKKFNTLATLLQFLLKKHYPDKLSKYLKASMHTVEQCNSNGDSSSCVIIANTEAELQEVEKEYNLKDLYPETDEYITADNQCWRKSVYVFDDYGNGIVLYELQPNKDEL